MMRLSDIIGHLYAMLGIGALGSVLSALVATAEPAVGQDPLAGTPVDRVVAFGDVHGGADELRRLLRSLQLIDGNDDWRGGQTRLVSLGDLLDRGPDSRAVMDLLMKLEAQALEAGGELFMVLGNHEIMNLTGDLRYVSQAEYAAFATDEKPGDRSSALAGFTRHHPELKEPRIEFDAAYPPGFFAHRRAFATTGHYGRWLLAKPQILVLDGTAFVHGGLSGAFVSEAIPEYNRRAAGELRSLLETGNRLVSAGELMPWRDFLIATPSGDEPPVPSELAALRQSLQFQADGPPWYRGTAACHPLIEQPRFEAVLEHRRLNRIVMGHTPTNPRIILSRFDGRAVLADTGMYAEYYHGRPSALIFAGDGLRMLTLSAEGVLQPRSGRVAIDIRAAGDVTMLADIESGVLGREFPRDQPNELIIGGRRLHATWRPEGRRERDARLAALALDRLVGFGLVAPIVDHQQNGTPGTLELLPANAISESQRASDRLFRPNYCSPGSDFDLMLILDALMGQEARNGDNLLYGRSTWLIYLTEQADAFPTSQRLPGYLDGRQIEVPPRVAGLLAKLTADALEEVLGDYLSKRQIRAILARRTALLARWPIAER